MKLKHLKPKANAGFLGGLISGIGGIAAGVGSMFGGGGGSSTKPGAITAEELARRNMISQDLGKLLGWNVVDKQDYKDTGFISRVDAQKQAILRDIESTKAALTSPGSRPYGVTDAQLQAKLSQLNADYQLANTDVAAFAKKVGLSAPNVKTFEQDPNFKSPDQLIQEQYQKDSDPIFQRFKQLLNQSLTDDFALRGANPEAARAEAERFVDDTFTAKARQQLDKYRSDLSARAAGLGRDPNLDSGTNNNFMQGLNDLALERGSRVAERTDLLAYQRPLEALQRSVGGLQTMQGQSGFISDLANRALQNRLSLLDSQSKINDQMARDRGVNVQNNTDMATRIGGGIQAGIKTAGGLSDLFKTFNTSKAPNIDTLVNGG